METDKSNFGRNVLVVFCLIAVLWIVQFISYYGVYSLEGYGIWPRHFEGLKGILFSPFIHGSFEHLISNTLPMMVLLMVLLSAYQAVALRVLVFVHILTGSMVWLFAPPYTVHIGISGIIYGIAGFLIASGLFRKDRTSVAIAILVALSYGGMAGGLFPHKGISWQSHVYGMISGIVIAFIFRRNNLPGPVEGELEPIEDDKHFFDQHKSVLHEAFDRATDIKH